MAKRTHKWIDVSVPIRDGMVHWPGDPEVSIEWALRMDKGDVCNVSRLSFGSHAGTHMDAPLHFIRNGTSLDLMPFEATIGPARVIAIKDRDSVKPEELRKHKLKAGERVIFKTRNSAESWRSNEFDKTFVHISHPAAQFLVERGVRTVGVDYLSVGGFERDGVETHQALLGAGIWLIEGLNLEKVQPGNYELVCLPLKVLGSEGAPARAILRKS